MAEMPLWSVVAWVARTVIGLMFLASALGKLRDLPEFVAGALNYKLLPEQVVRALAPILPAVELAVAAALLTATSPGLAAAASLVLLTVFAGAVAINLRRGRRILCFCGGAGSREVIGPATLARIFILAGAAIVVVMRGHVEPPWPDVGASPSAIVWPLSAVVSLCVLIVLLAPMEAVVREVLSAKRSRRLNGRSARESRAATANVPLRARSGR